MSQKIKVWGYCPRGCGATLELVDAGHSGGGRVMCYEPTCPRPYAVRDLLAEDRSGHVVEMVADGYTLHHPTWERIDDAYLECSVARELRRYTVPPKPPGTYRISQLHGAFIYTIKN